MAKSYKNRASCLRALRRNDRLEGHFCVSGFAGADHREFLAVEAGVVEDFLSDDLGRDLAHSFLQDRTAKRRYSIEYGDVLAKLALMRGR